MHPHQSVLLNEIRAAFHNKTLSSFFDGTLGAGGHAEAILTDHPEIHSFLGIDQDPTALQLAEKRLSDWKSKTHLIKESFDRLPEILARHQLNTLDGILLDLGVSSMQLDRPERGFSFSKEGPLDMRMDPDASLTAAEIVNNWSEKDLGRIFRDYGEEPRWRLAAKTIVEKRQAFPLHSTLDLMNILKPVLPWNPKKGINPLTLIFQGLRICVNQELDKLERFIESAINYLSPGGRLAVISFHSLEDRIVKNHFRLAASDKWDTVGIGGMFRDKTPTVSLVTRKPIVPSQTEIEANPRARSAKLRVIERI